MKKTLPARQLFKTWRRRRQRRVNLCEILCDNRDHRDHRDHRDNHDHRGNRDYGLWAEKYFLLDVVEAENGVESADEEEEEKQDQGGEEQAWPRLATSPPENMNSSKPVFSLILVFKYVISSFLKGLDKQEVPTAVIASTSLSKLFHDSWINDIFFFFILKA